MTCFPTRLPVFALIGACGFVIDSGVMTLVHRLGGVDLFLARGISFPLAVTCTWLLNRRWVFPGAARGTAVGEYAGYSLVQILGAATNLLIFVILIGWVPAMAAAPVVALGIGAAFSLGLNYSLLRWRVYPGVPAMPPDTAFYSGTANLEAMEGAERYNAFLLRTVASAAPDSVRCIVDFGAGTGTFAVPLAGSGLPILAVEPDPLLRERMLSRGLEVVDSLAGLPSGSVDYLYSLNVLEHIADDDAALRECARVLKEGGRLLIYVPAFMILFGSMDRLVGHHRRYRLGPLRRGVEEAGFDVIRAEYVDSIGFLAAMLLRYFGSASGVLNPVAVQAYDRWCFPVSRVLDLLTRRLFGKNLLILAMRLPRWESPTRA